MTEREFLQEILVDPRSGVIRTKYAKWLEEQGEFARAEFMRLTLHNENPQRLQELAANLPPNWLAIVSNPDVAGCGKEPQDGFMKRGRLSFDVICDKQWADLVSTDNDKVRFCNDCKREVYFCDTLADARTNARHNRCIAVDVGIPRKKGDMQSDLAMFGNPSEDMYREVDERNMDPVSQQRMNKTIPKIKRTVDSPWDKDEVVYED